MRDVNWKRMCVTAQDLCSKQDEVGDGGRNSVREEDEGDAKRTPVWGKKYSGVDIFELDSYVAKSEGQKDLNVKVKNSQVALY